jgi:hypothetical protein
LTNYAGILSGDGAINIYPSSGTVKCLFAGTVTWGNNYLNIMPSSPAIVDFTSGGNTFAYVQATNSGTINQMDSLIVTNSFIWKAGIWNTNNYNIQCSGFDGNAAGARTFSAGNSTITLTGTGTVFNPGTNITFNGTSSTIIISNVSASDKTFVGGGLTTYGTISITGGGAGAIIFTGSNTFNNFTINKPKTVNLTSTSIQTINGTFTALGDVSNAITLQAVTATSAAHFDLTYPFDNVAYVVAIDIDSDGGRTIYNPNGTNTRTANWNTSSSSSCSSSSSKAP